MLKEFDLLAGMHAYDSKNMLENDYDFLENEESDTELFIKYDSKKEILHIVFRGSDSRVDWKQNFRFMTVAYGNKKSKIRIHKGFYKKYQSVRDLIHALLQYYLEKYMPAKIFVTGHSLGAALAQLCAVDIQYNFQKNSAFDLVCYAFGSPRLGNRYFVKSFLKRIVNFRSFRNGCDIVTYIPFLFGYRETGKLTQIGKRQIFQCIKDHEPGRYLEEFHKK